jgi:hypothetical protein
MTNVKVEIYYGKDDLELMVDQELTDEQFKEISRRFDGVDWSYVSEIIEDIANDVINRR